MPNNRAKSITEISCGECGSIYVTQLSDNAFENLTLKNCPICTPLK